MPPSLSPHPLPLRHRLAIAAGLLLWGGAECLALWRNRRQHARTRGVGIEAREDRRR